MMAARKIKFGCTAVHTPTPSALFEVEFCNIRGLHSNLNAVHHHLETARPALLFLTETQILPPADTGYLKYPGYALEESFKAKAGVCLYVRADVCCRRLSCLEDPSFSMLAVHVDSGLLARVYVCLYRSHTGDAETTRLFDHLSRVADDAQAQFPNAELVFLGDFNAHHGLWLGSSKTDHAGISAHAFALTHDLTQLVDQPTRIPDIASQAPSLLDLLLTTHPQEYQIVVRAPLGSSDHCLISVKVPQAKTPRPLVVKRRVWHYGSADWDGMRDYFASVPWKQRCFNEKDLSSSAVAITEEIVMGMEYYIPHSDLISKGTRNRWFNRDCADAVSPDAQRVARTGHELLTHPTGSRSFWRLAKAVQHNFCQPSLPPLRCPDGSLAHEPQEKADLLAKLFAANSRISDCNALPPTLPHCGTTMPDIKIRQLGYESFDEIPSSPDFVTAERLPTAKETPSSYYTAGALFTTQLPSPSVLDIPMLNRKRFAQREKELEEMREKNKQEEMANKSTSRTPKRVLLRDENKYEPYWFNGEWVFYRTIRPYIKLRTPKPMPTTTFSRTESTSTTPPYNQETTTIAQNLTTYTEFINYACQHPCSDIFENYGRVCAQRFNAFSYEYKEFDDFCDMIDENCIYHATTTASFNQDLSNFRGPWYVIMRGGCYMLYTTFEPAPTDAAKLLERVQFYNTLNFERYSGKG
ncbi:unnamed protein product [Chilo suppressalis]|uniref:Endonuclease/exonuclease/phosphatase domain-containing protein n=1 Tax=Chilo suppressalis TaxID=168631 RepID=A0ABN8B5B1_CHISP|nr:unnamed protein product [Chilo suppressalis]